MKLAKTILVASTVMLFTLPVRAQSVIDEPFCYMQMGGELLDLTEMCGVPALVPALASTRLASDDAIEAQPSNSLPSDFIAGGGRTTGESFVDATTSDSVLQSSFGRSGGGSCQFAWQTDSSGRRCGNRAASRRSGGR